MWTWARLLRRVCGRTRRQLRQSASNSTRKLQRIGSWCAYTVFEINTPFCLRRLGILVIIEIVALRRRVRLHAEPALCPLRKYVFPIAYRVRMDCMDGELYSYFEEHISQAPSMHRDPSIVGCFEKWFVAPSTAFEFEEIALQSLGWLHAQNQPNNRSWVEMLM